MLTRCAKNYSKWQRESKFWIKWNFQINLFQPVSFFNYPQNPVEQMAKSLGYEEKYSKL